MRIRSIKPEFWRSDDIDALSIPDRLLFIGLWSYVDDSGIGIDKESAIAADLFAGDLSSNPHECSVRVHGGLKRLNAAGLITRYSVHERRFLHIVNWNRHQKINRPSETRYPLPTCDDAEIHGGLSEDSVSPPANYPFGTGEQGNRGTEEKDFSSRIEDPRPDVEALCSHLAERIEEGGSKRPSITKAWRDDARLMLDRDKRDLDESHRLIDWATNDTFWRTNILSMSKFRKQWDQLRAKSTLGTQLRAVSGGWQPFQNPTDPNAYDEPLLRRNP